MAPIVMPVAVKEETVMFQPRMPPWREKELDIMPRVALSDAVAMLEPYPVL